MRWVVPLLFFWGAGDYERVRELLALVDKPMAGRAPEKEEREYQELVGKRTLADLALVYAPENRERLKIAYAAFTPMDGPPGLDLGYGLHVVKRLELGDRVIDVNEHWAQNRADGGLFPPDEVRVKTLVFPEETGHRRYLFDRVRLAFGEGGLPVLHREARYAPTVGGKVSYRQRRTSVSAPITCDACHRPGATFTRLSDRYLAEGETRNPEAIVQDSYFARRVEEMHGFNEYLAQLEAEERDPAFIARVRAALLDPRRTFALKGLGEVKSWLPDDEEIAEPNVPRQGAYSRRGKWFLDALEATLPGKYVSWSPASAVP